MRHVTFVALFLFGALVGCQNAKYTRPRQTRMDSFLAESRLSQEAKSIRGMSDDLALGVLVFEGDVVTDLPRANSGESLEPFRSRLQALESKLAEIQGRLRDYDAAVTQSGTRWPPIGLLQTRYDLPELAARLEKIRLRLERLEERHAVDASRFHEQRQKYREHLLRGIGAEGVPDSCVYAESPRGLKHLCRPYQMA